MLEYAPYMSKVERDIGIERDTPIAGVCQKTHEFVMESIKRGLYRSLDAQTRNLIGLYFGTESSIRELLPYARKEDGRSFSPPKTSRLILEGLKTMWEGLPENIKNNFPKEEVIKLKDSRITSSRTLEKKRIGTKGQWEDGNKKSRLMTGLRRAKQTPAFREKMSRIAKSPAFTAPTPEKSKKISDGLKKNYKRKREDIRNEAQGAREHWEYAVEHNLFPQILESGVLSQVEINTLRNYFESGVIGRKLKERLFDSLSIAVARLG